jgi:hypothetical protein
MSRYMDPTTDFGFKKLFGEEANKDIIISFITDVLELEAPLLDIQFLDKEQLPEAKEERIGIYDIFCQDVDGNRFIVEMQKSRLAYVKDRMIYYSTFPIAAQAKRGDEFLTSLDTGIKADRIRDVDVLTFGKKSIKTSWNYYLDGVYCIAILAYRLNGSIKAVNRNSLRNDEPPHEQFYDKLRFVTIELPLFDENKPGYSLDLHLNKWLYFLKYLPTFDVIPKLFEGDVVFQKAFRIAEMASFTPEERRAYNLNLKRIWDSYAALETSYHTGRKKGVKKGIKIGEKRGEFKGKIESLLMLLKQKLGPVPTEIERNIWEMDNVDQINEILCRVFEIDDWETLNKQFNSLLP